MIDNAGGQSMYENDRVLGRLPELMKLEDGRKVNTAELWQERRQEILDRPMEIEFGGMPPKPERFDYRLIAAQPLCEIYEITAGTAEDTFSFHAEVYFPDGFDRDRKYPAVINGDGCWRERPKFYESEVRELFRRREYLFVLFDRTEYAPDNADEARNGSIYRVYGRETPFSTISAWAYGYHLVTSLLLQLSYVDPAFIAATGHSRGGKAALLAGATDERIAFVNPNCSGSHGCGCWRYETRIPDAPEGQDAFSEPLPFMIENIPYWLGSELMCYAGREAELPYDMHYFKALCAPRWFLETDALADIWANPHGSYQTYLAAKPAFELLGVSERALIFFREGGHGHLPGDYAVLLDLMDSVRRGEPLPDSFHREYFPGLQPIF